MRTLIEYGLQPLILIAVMLVWIQDPDNPVMLLGVILSVQLVLGTLEHLVPARPEWVQSLRLRAVNLALFTVLMGATVAVSVLYAEWIHPHLDALREQLGIAFWPEHWPLLAQALLAFFASEFIWYWLHRAEHRFAFFWKLSGHGAHHAFKNLGAINFGLNHPLELLVIAAPAALVELLFGAGLAMAGGSILLVAQASIAHSNLKLNSRGIGLLFTTNEYHLMHHSMVLEESNTNYGCSAILWDRVFGTFRPGIVAETGIGEREPTLWEKFLMPVKDPVDSAVSPRA